MAPERLWNRLSGNFLQVFRRLRKSIQPLALKNTYVDSLCFAVCIVLKLVFDVFDFCASVRSRQAVLTQVNEHHFVDGEDALAGDLVAHFTGEGDRGTAEFGGGDAQLDDVALT